MTALPINHFKRDLHRRQQIGLFSTMASPMLAELLAACGYDWLLIDTEHSPNELPNVIDHMRAISAHGVAPIVRPAWSDMILVKRVLDAGAQSLLFPYVQTPEEAALAVSYTRYPPQGVRGVSGSSRAAGYGLVPNYLKTATDEICVIVQIENGEALDQIEQIAAVDGVDAVFIGPADLAASLGHLGDTQHPTVQKAIDEGFARLKRIGKPSGYLTTNDAEAKRRLADGVSFVGVGTDTSVITRAATALAQQMKAG